MEFKKPNRYNGRRPGQDVSPRGTTSTNPQSIRHVASADTSNLPAQPQVTPTTPVGITHNTPQKSSTIARIRRTVFTKKALVIITIIVVAGTGFFIVKLFSPEKTVVATAPTYKTILPEKKSISDLGGWKRISPPEKDPVFAYADEINNVPISISQQPLPQSFRNNVDNQVAELAKKFNATTKIDAGDTMIYLGTSAKGPQSAILAKKDVLIMIKSEKKITDAAWASYAKSLN